MSNGRIAQALVFAALIASAASTGACTGDRSADRASVDSQGGNEQPRSDTTVDLLGAGATFPYPLYSRWFNRFAQDSGVRINYLSIGSGDGISSVIADSVDFGATDVPMSDAEVARVPGGRVLHVPMVLGAVALTYNVTGLTRPLRVSADVLAAIFMGELRTWDDRRLAALNPDQSLPPDSIQVVHREDPSGTSFIFSDYLSTISQAWQRGPGRGRAIAWPIGTAARGNEGVAAQVKQTLGAIGYVEGSYARLNRLPVARVRNAAGEFIAPAAFEIAAAAVSVLDEIDEPTDLRVSIVNAPGRQAYPIASFSWLLVVPATLSELQAQQMLQFIGWALADGELTARELGYEPLPTVLAERVFTSVSAQLPSTRANR